MNRHFRKLSPSEFLKISLAHYFKMVGSFFKVSQEVVFMVFDKLLSMVLKKFNLLVAD